MRSLRHVSFFPQSTWLSILSKKIPYRQVKSISFGHGVPTPKFWLSTTINLTHFMGHGIFLIKPWTLLINKDPYPLVNKMFWNSIKQSQRSLKKRAPWCFLKWLHLNWVRGRIQLHSSWPTWKIQLHSGRSIRSLSNV